MRIKAQSEMVGFALIIIIVAVIILVFLSISLNKTDRELVESREASNFLNSMLDYTTTCETSQGNYATLKKLADRCIERDFCLENEEPCELLEETLDELLPAVWNVGPEWPTKGYTLNITSKGEPVLGLQEGNITRTAKGAIQSYDGGLDIAFSTYY